MIMRGVVLNELEKAGRFAAHYLLRRRGRGVGASWETARDALAGEPGSRGAQIGSVS